MFRTAEYRPDQEENLLSIWTGNLSSSGKSCGMSVHLLIGTCAQFQQLLTGNTGHGLDSSQQGPAAATTHVCLLVQRQQETSRASQGKARWMSRHLGRVHPVPCLPQLAHPMQGSSPCGTESGTVSIPKAIRLTARSCSLSGVTKQNHEKGNPIFLMLFLK